MEIKKVLYVLLIGVVLCLIFAGILQCVKDAGREEEMVNQPTATPYVQVGSVPVEVPTDVPVIQVMQVTAKPVEEPAKISTDVPTVEPTVVPTETPTEEPTEVPTEVPTKVPTEVPTEMPTKEPPKKTMAPEATQAPLPQSTNTPMPTQEPPAEEEEHVHEFEKAVWELPSCQKGGYYNNICKTCGFEESVTQEPLPHQVEDVIIQEGNCMEDRVIRHICTECETQIGSDTRYPLYDKHQWGTEEVDGELVEYCERCGVVK